MARRFISIRTQLIVFLLVLIIIPVFIGFFVYHRAAYSVVETQLADTRIALLEQHAVNINRIIGQLNTAVNFLSYSTSVDEFIEAADRSHDAEIFLAMQKVRSIMQMVSSASFQHATQPLLIYGPYTVTNDYDVSRNAHLFRAASWYGQALSDPRRLHWSIEPFIYWTEQGFVEKQLLTVSRTVGPARSGKYQAVVSVSMDMNQIESYTNPLITLDTGFPGNEPAVSAGMHDLSIPLENGWMLHYGLSDEAMLGEFSALQAQGLLIISILGVLLGCVIIVNVWMGTRSLHQLKLLMQRVEHGELSVRMPDFPPHEIGMLASQINDMLDQIQLLFAKVKEEHQLAEEARFLQLKSQIRPHFLLNSLNSVSWAARLSGADHVGQIASNLTSIMERVLYEKDDFVLLTRELDTLKQYLALEELRSGDCFDITIDTSGIIGDPYCPAFCLQPLVENSIKHGISSEENTDMLQITVWFQVKDSELLIYVDDTGPGFTFDPSSESQDNLDTHGGIGLTNIDRRLRTYFGDRYGVHVQKIQRGSSVCLRMPYLEECP